MLRVSVCTYEGAPKDLHIVFALKRLYRVYYTYNGEQYNLKALYNHLPHNRRGDIIASATVQIHNQNKKEMTVKIVFLRSNKKIDGWIALLTTGVKHDEGIIRIYAKRWNIEVLFIISMHYLKLDTELERWSFESMYAHCAIVLLCYLMIAYNNRISEDD